MIRILLFAALLTCSLIGRGHTQSYFGYAGVLCGLEVDGEDFAADVAPFTNIAHVCPTGDIATDAARLARAWELGMTPLFHVEPFFFAGASRRNTYDLWQAGQQAIAQSGVPEEALVLYVADEPTLRRFRLNDIADVIRRINEDLPAARTMVIDGYHDRLLPQIPFNVDYWGFNMYLMLDPMQDPVFMEYFEDVILQTSPSIDLVLVMDATHTPMHSEVGLAPEDMAQVARNYAALAANTDRVAMLLAYAWPGGIEWENELGTRDLPQSVRAAHAEIGRAITGR